jgi:hypothetical protein
MYLRGPFRRGTRSRSLQRVASHTSSPFAGLCKMRTPRRALSSPCSSVNYSPLSAALASSLSSSAPSPSCSGSACVRDPSSVPHYLPATSRRSTLHRQAPNPKNAIGREEYIDSWRECVHDLLTQIVAIFLERSTANLPPENVSQHSLLPASTTQLFSRLLDALRLALPR